MDEARETGMPLAGHPGQRSKGERLGAEAGGTHSEASERCSCWCLLLAGLTQKALPSHSHFCCGLKVLLLLIRALGDGCR